ncbi:MAG: response regulator [Pseudomonadota bacterium]
MSGDDQATTGTSAGVPLTGIRVLIVEDEALIAMDLEDLILDGGGLLVAPPLRTCREALAVSEAQDIDLAILDVSLPDGEVYPVAEVLRTRDIPLIFHSGHAAHQDIKGRFPNAGWIAKPSDTSVIMDTLLTLMDL